MIAPHAMGQFLDRLLHRFASLRLAIFVIVALAAYLAIGTVYESRYGQRAASEIVYRSPAFVGILALLAMNVMAAAVVRIPWKRHQTGFVITHLGIEVLLLGCLIGSYRGLDGRIVLRPGQSGDVIDLEDQQIAVFDQTGDSAIAAFPLRLSDVGAYPSVGRFVLSCVWPFKEPAARRPLGEFEGVGVDLLEWHPAVRVEGGLPRPIRVPVERLDEAVAAAKVRLSAMGKSRDVWLVRGEKPVEIPTPGGVIRIGYGFEATRLPFAIKLGSADRDDQPGKSAAARLSATVEVAGANYPVAPNAPAVVDGMTIYLSGIETIDGEKHAFLAVRRDPGWPIKYAGCALVVCGTALMFAIRKPRTEPAASQPGRSGLAVSHVAPRTGSLPLGLAASQSRGARMSLVVLGFAALVTCASASRGAADEPLRMIPVQHDGRIKPIDTMAREIVRSVTGREGDDALLTLLRWAGDETVDREAILLVSQLDLRSKLEMPADQKWISPAALATRGEFGQWAGDLMARRSQAAADGEDVELSPLEKDAVALVDRLALFRRVQSGEVFRIVPTEGQWAPIGDSGAPADLKQNWVNLLLAARGGRGPEIVIYSGAVYDQVIGLSKVDPAGLRLEVRYHALRPFRWVGACYAIVLLVLLVQATIRPGAAFWPGVSLLGAAILLHAGAFVWRCAITRWAPVTNMYESIVWVGGVAALIGLILAVLTKARAAAIAGAIVALLACVVGDVIPPELGRAIKNLPPVLQSNLWLTIHVLTIVSSYAAFAVALVLANGALWQMTRRFSVAASRLNQAQTASLPSPTSNLLYRTLQIGVVLVAAGTVLGGVWADVSWGRFWGWDPKEVWALIVLLSYLALLHGRYAGWVGPFGLAAGSVVCFLTVLMSWYGVNFVLGVGLHSYGFGAGGLQYVLAYAAVQIAFVLWAWWRTRSAADGHGLAPLKEEVEAATRA